MKTDENAECLLHVLRLHGKDSDKMCYRTAANLKCGGAYRFIDLAYKDPSISRAESDKRLRGARMVEGRLPALRKYKKKQGRSFKKSDWELSHV